jgi:hypothetical protein
MTAANDYDDLHHLVDRLTPGQAERLRVLVASDPELSPTAEPEGERAPKRRLSSSVSGSPAAAISPNDTMRSSASA